MPKLSAGIIVYKVDKGRLYILLVHPGGPLWKNKDDGAWSIPKGEYGDDEDALAAAKREFEEETGNVLPDKEFTLLAPVKIKSGKIISAWAVQADFEKLFIRSNYFEMEWPPRSGKKQSFPETDNAEWFTIEEAKNKINKGQLPFLEQMMQIKNNEE